MRASRARPECASIANVGLPNAMTQMVNTYKDRIPLLVVVAAFGQDTARAATARRTTTIRN